MGTRMGWVLAAGVALTGCAEHRASTRVGDETLARVPQEDLGEVNQRRMELSRANDAVARQRLEVQAAEHEVSLAKQEIEVAEAEQKRAEQLDKTASFERDTARRGQAKAEIEKAATQLRVAEARVKSAKAQLELKREGEALTRAQAKHAQARVEWAKYQALERSGDPSAKGMSGTKLENAVTAADGLELTLGLREALRELFSLRLRLLDLRLRGGAPRDQGVGGAGE